MKNTKIDIDEELYLYIASHTQNIGEDASTILRRMLKLPELKKPLPMEIKNVVSSNHLKSALYMKQPAINMSQKEESEMLQQILFLQHQLSVDQLKKAHKAIDRFMLILSALFLFDEKAFSQSALSLKGRKRLYFACDADTLYQAGKHTKPQQVPNTPYWVITNTNTARKCNIIELIMQEMRFAKRCIADVKYLFTITAKK